MTNPEMPTHSRRAIIGGGIGVGLAAGVATFGALEVVKKLASREPEATPGHFFTFTESLMHQALTLGGNTEAEEGWIRVGFSDGMSTVGRPDDNYYDIVSIEANSPYSTRVEGSRLTVTHTNPAKNLTAVYELFKDKVIFKNKIQKDGGSSKIELNAIEIARLQARTQKALDIWKVVHATTTIPKGSSA